MRCRLFLLPLFLTACATGGMGPQGWLAARNLDGGTPGRFSNCRGYNCRIVDEISLTPQMWKPVETLFSGLSTAAEERAAVAAAIGMMERITGAQNGTADDVAGTYVKLGDTQQDCVDESTNTTVYLTLLEQKKLLRFHDVRMPATRWPFYTGHFAPHRTAVMAERETGERYAVDGWFYDNGHPAEIVPLEQWLHGWSP